MPGLVGELVPGCTAVVEEVVVGREDAVREAVLAHELPDVLDRVQLGALGRQRHEGDVWRDDQALREMPSGLVEEKHGVGSRRALAISARCRFMASVLQAGMT